MKLRTAWSIAAAIVVACGVPSPGFATGTASYPCTVDSMDKKVAHCPKIEISVVAKADGCHAQLKPETLDIPKGTKDVSIDWVFKSGTSPRYVFNLFLNNGIEFDDKDKEFDIVYAGPYAVGATDKNNKKNPHPYLVHVADSFSLFAACIIDPTIVNQGQ